MCSNAVIVPGCEHFCNSACIDSQKMNSIVFLLFYSVLAISRSVSPSTEPDQEAASPLIYTSPDDSEVGAWYLGLKLKTSKD